MGWFHQLAADMGSLPPTIYHMCPAKAFAAAKLTYFPPTYDDDKFTRAIHDPSRLIETANCFYQKSSRADEEWVCLQIDTMSLRVDGIEVTMEASEVNPDQQCPRIFGGIPKESVKKTYKIERNTETGEFVTVCGLTDSCALSK
jgi:Protein of unknown function (DUF952)